MAPWCLKYSWLDSEGDNVMRRGSSASFLDAKQGLDSGFRIFSGKIPAHRPSDFAQSNWYPGSRLLTCADRISVLKTQHIHVDYHPPWALRAEMWMLLFQTRPAVCARVGHTFSTSTYMVADRARPIRLYTHPCALQNGCAWRRQGIAKHFTTRLER